jgi:carbon storage regulator
MLILSRRPGESLVLDGGIRIDILSSDGRTVRLGIEAPPDVRILRAEIVESVKAETRRAAESAVRWAAGSAPLGAVLSPSLAPNAATPPTTAE